MARKKKSFQWSADATEVEEPVERRDRKEERAQNRALDRLALRLASLTLGERTRLPLDDQLLEELALLASLGPQSAHRRQLLRVQGLLRVADLAAIEAGLAGEVQDDARLWSTERWRSRIIAGGDAELEAYVAEHPGADRQHLRSLARQARGQGPAAAGAARRLFQAMKADVPIGEE